MITRWSYTNCYLALRSSSFNFAQDITSNHSYIFYFYNFQMLLVNIKSNFISYWEWTIIHTTSFTSLLFLRTSLEHLFLVLESIFQKSVVAWYWFVRICSLCMKFSEACYVIIVHASHRFISTLRNVQLCRRIGHHVPSRLKTRYHQ